MNRQVLLAAEGVSKDFGGVAALRDVSFDVRDGEIHAICGENGAGKSTLIKLLSGQFSPGSYTGQLRFQGEPVVFRNVREAEAAGIAVIHQEMALVESLSVAENLFLGRLPQRAGRIDWPRMLASAREVLDRLGADLDPEMRVADLGMGQKQLVEITRALSRNPRLLILDEPTAALGEEEVEVLSEHLDRLRCQGVSAVYISHKLGEILALADRVTVLRDGSSVRTQEVAELTPDALIEQMVGRELREVYPPRGTHGRGDIGGILTWPEPWCQPFRDLLSHPPALRYMLELIGNGFRYGNANGISMTTGAEGCILHGGGVDANQHRYRYQNGTMWNNLMGVCYQLADINPGDGGFVCIPGSHKANFDCPEDVQLLERDIGCFKHLPMKAGSALIFTEALTHGTLPWQGAHERRTLLYRYAAGAFVNARGMNNPEQYAPFLDELTPLQQALMEPPYNPGRPDIAALLKEEEKTV